MVSKSSSVLIVDDEPVVCNLLSQELSERGYCCTSAQDGKSALVALAAQEYDTVLLDILLLGISGMDVLRRIRQDHPGVTAIMITAVNEVDMAVQAMQFGASDYIVKPFEMERVVASVGIVSQSGPTPVERKDYKLLSPYASEKPSSENSGDEWLKEMNAIARGVKSKLDVLVGHSSIVTERTAYIGLHLGIPEREVRRWVSARQGYESEKSKVTDLLLVKVRQSLFAKAIENATRLLIDEANMSEYAG